VVTRTSTAVRRLGFTPVPHAFGGFKSTAERIGSFRRPP
jgi:hypothetical protein